MSPLAAQRALHTQRTARRGITGTCAAAAAAGQSGFDHSRGHISEGVCGGKSIFERAFSEQHISKLGLCKQYKRHSSVGNTDLTACQPASSRSSSAGMDVDMQNEKGAARAETAELYDQVTPGQSSSCMTEPQCRARASCAACGDGQDR